MRWLRNLGLIVFLTVSGILITMYFVALFDKFSNPHIKNLRTIEFFWLSPVVAGFIVLDYFILRRILKWIQGW